MAFKLFGKKVDVKPGSTPEQVEAQIAPTIEKRLGSKSLAQLAATLRGVLRVAGPRGVQAMRTKIIKSVEDDARRSWREGGSEATEALLQEALATPEYMALLKDLGMDESHLRVIIKEVHDKEAALPDKPG